MAAAPLTGFSPAATDLGLGGDLASQVKDETEEQRKKRMMAIKQQAMSPGAMSLLGGGALGGGTI